MRYSWRMRRKLRSPAMHSSIDSCRMEPAAKVSLPRVTLCWSASSSWIWPSASTWATSMRMLVAPMSITASGDAGGAGAVPAGAACRSRSSTIWLSLGSWADGLGLCPCRRALDRRIVAQFRDAHREHLAEDRHGAVAGGAEDFLADQLRHGLDQAPAEDDHVGGRGGSPRPRLRCRCARRLAGRSPPPPCRLRRWRGRACRCGCRRGWSRPPPGGRVPRPGRRPSRPRTRLPGGWPPLRDSPCGRRPHEGPSGTASMWPISKADPVFPRSRRPS